MKEISALLVKQLRTRSGAGIMDCKEALIKSNGDIERAMEVLREEGLSVSSIKGGRTTSDGLVHAYITSNKRIGVLVEVNCETDFVAKTPTFKAFVHEVAKLIAECDPENLNEMFSLRMANGDTIDFAIKSLINSFGENMNVRRFERFEVSEVGEIGSYIHEDYLTEGKIGVMVELSVAKPDTLSAPEFKLLMNSLLMQITASRPKYVQVGEIPADVLEREKTVLRNQIFNEGKSGKFADEILNGRLRKFYQDSCLLEQGFIKDPDKTIGDLLHVINEQLSAERISITRFARFKKSETIDK